MKHYILISVSLPVRTQQRYSEGIELSERLRKLAEATKGIVPLGGCSWLLPRSGDLIFLAQCVGEASKYAFPHRIWFLDGED